MAKDERKQITDAIAKHRQMLADLQKDGIDIIIGAVEMIADSLSNGGCVYICGNGGSAADAQHIAGELVGRFAMERKGLAAVALSTDTSVLTSIANDYGYEKVFTRQVEALVKEGDIFWAISTSGNSLNIVDAAKLARQYKAMVLAFTGKINSELEKIADICFCAEAKTSFRCQEIHQLAYHVICELVEQRCCE